MPTSRQIINSLIKAIKKDDKKEIKKLRKAYTTTGYILSDLDMKRMIKKHSKSKSLKRSRKYSRSRKKSLRKSSRRRSKKLDGTLTGRQSKDLKDMMSHVSSVKEDWTQEARRLEYQKKLEKERDAKRQEDEIMDKMLDTPLSRVEYMMLNKPRDKLFTDCKCGKRALIGFKCDNCHQYVF
jgi:hypothetical protein